jgi:hypothetical protein
VTRIQTRQAAQRVGALSSLLLAFATAPLVLSGSAWAGRTPTAHERQAITRALARLGRSAYPDGRRIQTSVYRVSTKPAGWALGQFVETVNGNSFLVVLRHRGVGWKATASVTKQAARCLLRHHVPPAVYEDLRVDRHPTGFTGCG